jgi:hypothetical protein
MPLLMSIDSSKREEMLNRICKIIWYKKEKTGIVQLRYINDIHVIDVFFAKYIM